MSDTIRYKFTGFLKFAILLVMIFAVIISVCPVFAQAEESGNELMPVFDTDSIFNDYEKIIYGFDDIDSLKADFENPENLPSSIVNGTQINIKDKGNYNVVIFGDADCDGIIDARDAVLTECISQGMLTPEKHQEYAGDCNHDGKTDENDVYLMQMSGVFTAEINQKEFYNVPESDTLVVYFSATNTTKTLAEYAAEYLNADIYSITPEVPYSAEDIAYYTNCRADREQSDPTARPQIKDLPLNINSYDTIILGYPIWHSQAPKIVYTFLESFDLTGKTILPFCTSHSSPLGSSAQNLHTAAPSANWLAGMRFAAGTSSQTISDWLDENGIEPYQPQPENDRIINITVNGKEFKAELYECAAADEILEMLPMTINMSELNSNEKYYWLSKNLTVNNQRVNYINEGDLMIYSSNCLVLFYDSFSTSYSYTPIGRITDTSGLKNAVGTGSAAVTFSK